VLLYGRRSVESVDLIADFFVCEDGEDIVDGRELREPSANRKALQEKNICLLVVLGDVLVAIGKQLCSRKVNVEASCADAS
jgi:hypothetical protein